jgi:hypothetical protein
MKYNHSNDSSNCVILEVNCNPHWEGLLEKRQC